MCCSNRAKDGRMKIPVVTVSNQSRAAILKLEQSEIELERFV